MNRIGFHYFQDTNHYRQRDLETWLPELNAMKTSWLVLFAPTDRAIPEPFLRGILDANIEPVLHFHLSPDRLPPFEDLSMLFQVYGKWGVQYVTLFNKPNLRTIWQTTNWAQTDLVERFLDIYLPLSAMCLSAGLTPIFPPLEPGGDYWDTAFLKASLQGIKRRGYKHLLDKLVIGAYARTGEQSLNWGAGGPERWPDTRPYFTPDDKEDQQGFRIFDWYNAIVQAVLVEPRSIFLFEVGCLTDDGTTLKIHTQKNLEIAQLLDGEEIVGIEPIPSNVIGSAFWLLSAPQGSPQISHAWYKTISESRPIVQVLRNWAAGSHDDPQSKQLDSRFLSHYLLLPSFNDEISDVHLELIRPFIKKYKPTIGFSLEEAQHANRVTVIGGNGLYPDGSINHLRNSGCVVQEIDDSGIDIASMVAC
jgi:hypothetical protein